jgi:putative sterol carrier protein
MRYLRSYVRDHEFAATAFEGPRREGNFATCAHPCMSNAYGRLRDAYMTSAPPAPPWPRPHTNPGAIAMQVDIAAVNDRVGLADAIAGKSDDEINRSLVGRSALVVSRVAERMKTYFVPEKGPQQRVVIQYQVKTPDGVLPFQVTLANGRCEVEEGVADHPTMTLNMSLPNFLRLASGKLGGLTAMVTGRLDVSGDVLLARKVQSWFQ